MNIHEANKISMCEILTKLSIHPHKINKNNAWYFSPFRQERTPSFQVDLYKNRWYDFGEAMGGDLVDFICAYLKHHKEENTKSDALRWIRNMCDNSVELLNFHPKIPQAVEKDFALILKNSRSIQHLGLINYLEKRGIPLFIAQKYLKELHVYNKDTGKKFFTLGLPNEEGGFELRNPFFKGCLRTKAISFIRGKISKPQGIHIFEGLFDYLSVACDLKGQFFQDDAIILNSLSCLRQINPYIRNYGYETAYTWMDNDHAGENATVMLAEFFKTQEGITHKIMNNVYAPHKDVNAWHMSQLNLSL
ncbi:transposase [Emticicia aquatilis]|uniref:Transposase n=1 Tax=Emticicia aquatilis TaxID=1537369 RepID=A0A916YW89_9BACT|nr:toprim domain-containing protein [Emticicia aquatilis]GGD64264.1 transposase [Emticicia aquatilis]